MPTPVLQGPAPQQGLQPAFVPVTEPAELPAEMRELPGTKELLVAPRDPRCLYVHWDLSRQQQQEYAARSADGRLALRVYAGGVGGALVAQIQLPTESHHGFVAVPRGGIRYQVELGFTDSGGNWVGISTSGVVATPPDEVVAAEPATFATVPVEVPPSRLAELAKEAGLEQVPLVEAIEQLRARGLLQLAEPVAVAVTTRPGAGLQAMVMGLPIGQFGSEAAAQILPGLIEQISSPTRAEYGRRGFWFNINAELVIYGATEPDAKVTLGGLPVKLRADGTFSCRVALPDGQFDLAAEAVSADQTEVRMARFRFSRATEYQGAGTAQTQAHQI